MSEAETADVQSGWGERLAAARLAAGLTQPALAALLGVAIKTVTRWEAVGRSDEGRRPNSLDQRRIAAALGLPTLELFPRDDFDVSVPGRLAEYDELLERVGGGCS